MDATFFGATTMYLNVRFAALVFVFGLVTGVALTILAVNVVFQSRSVTAASGTSRQPSTTGSSLTVMPKEARLDSSNQHNDDFSQPSLPKGWVEQEINGLKFFIGPLQNAEFFSMREALRDEYPPGSTDIRDITNDRRR